MIVGVNESSGAKFKVLSQLAAQRLTKLRGCFYIFIIFSILES
jgi:hypothetical protein